jgi:hypothetical protein
MSPRYTQAGFAAVPGSRWGLMVVGLFILPK